MLYPKVKPMCSTRTDAPVNNQFCIELGGGSYAFQSYHSLIAVKHPDGTVEFSPHWDYSRTTTKYLNQWLDEYAYALTRQSSNGARGLVKDGLVSVTLNP